MHVFIEGVGLLGPGLNGWDASRPILKGDAAYVDAPTIITASDLLPAAERRRTGIPVKLALAHGTDGSTAVLLVLDEGDPLLVDATMALVAAECAAAEPLDEALVERWLHHRNDVSALEALTKKGFVVDTMEIAAPWGRLPAVYQGTRDALLAVPTCRAATAHLSHSYSDGACLYFTFAATPQADEVESSYIALWDAGTRAVLQSGGNLSHHHGIGINRARFLQEALGPAHGVLRALKSALDPNGILNPGKLALPSPFGVVSWPEHDRA